MLLSPVCMAQDQQGCKDSPLVSRFPGSFIRGCKNLGDEKFTFTLDNSKKQDVEGEFHQIEYKFPSTASKAQVVRNMNTALRKAGYTMVYDSKGHFPLGERCQSRPRRTGMPSDNPQ